MGEQSKLQQIFKNNSKRIRRILLQNGVDPDNLPEANGTPEERSRIRTQQTIQANQRRIDKIMRKYR